MCLTPDSEFSDLLVHPWQLDTGIKGVTPGPDTEEYLAKRERELRTLGGLSMAALAAVTQLFDAWCHRTLGIAIGTLSLLLLVGLVTSAVRQVTTSAMS